MPNVVTLDNPVNGTHQFIMFGVVYTLRFDWAALSVLEKEYPEPDLSNRVVLSQFAAAGLKQFHPELTVEEIWKQSPPFFVLHAAVNTALRFAYYGGEDPEELVGKMEGKRQPSKNASMWQKFCAWRGVWGSARKSSGA